MASKTKTYRKQQSKKQLQDSKNQFTQRHQAALKAVQSRFNNRLKEITYYQRKKLLNLTTQYYEARNQINVMDKETIIASEIRHTTSKSFYRFGDRNQVTPGIILHYFRTNGVPLDIQSKNLTESFGIDINVQDLADFIISYPNGTSHFHKFVEMKTVETAIKEITTFNTTKKLVDRIRKIFTPKTKRNHFKDCPF
jgi:hypothetical protein